MARTQTEYEQLFAAQLRGTFSRAAVSKMAGVFMRCDLVGDGFLNRDELTAFLEELYLVSGTQSPPDEVLRQQVVNVFRKYDKDGNRRLDPVEVCGYLRESHFVKNVGAKWQGPSSPRAAAGPRRRSRRQRLREVFDLADVDGDGKLSVSDVCHWVKETVVKVEESDFAHIFVDTDVLSFEQFLKPGTLPMISAVRQKKAQQLWITWEMQRFEERCRMALPELLLSEIFAYVGDLSTLRACATCCGRWRRQAATDELWRPLLVARRRRESGRIGRSAAMLPEVRPARGQSCYQWYLQWVREAFSDVRQQRAARTAREELVNGTTAAVLPLDTPVASLAVADHRVNGTPELVAGDEKGVVFLRGFTPDGDHRQVLNEHDGTVGCLAVTKNLLWCGSDDCTVSVWNRRVLNRPEFILLGHKEAVTALAVAPWDERLCVTGGLDHKVILWDHVQKRPQSRQSSSRLVSGLRKETAEQVRPRWEVAGHGMKVSHILLTQRFIFSGSRDASVSVWDWDGTRLHQILDHTGPINQLGMLSTAGPGREFPALASACGGGFVKAWRADTWQQVASRHVHQGPIDCVFAIPGEPLVVTGGWDSMVRITNVHTNLVAAELKGHTDIVQQVWCDGHRKRIVSGSVDQRIAVWCYASADLSAEKVQIPPLYFLLGPKTAVTALCVVLRDPPPAAQSTSETPDVEVTGSFGAPFSLTVEPWQCIVAAAKEKTLFFWEFREDAPFNRQPVHMP